MLRISMKILLWLLKDFLVSKKIPFDVFRFERDVPKVDEIEEFCKFYR